MMPPPERNDAARVASLAGRWICVTGDDVWSSLLVLFASGPAHAFAGEFDAVGVVNETIEDGVGIGRIADYFLPREKSSSLRSYCISIRRLITSRWCIFSLWRKCRIMPW